MRYRNESNLTSCIVFRPVGLRFRPVGLRFRPVGLRFRPVGLRSSVFVFGSSFSTHPALIQDLVGLNIRRGLTSLQLEGKLATMANF